MSTDILICLDVFVGIGFKVFSCCDWYERSRFEVCGGRYCGRGDDWSRLSRSGFRYGFPGLAAGAS